MFYKLYCGEGNHIISDTPYVMRSKWNGSGMVGVRNPETVWLGNNHFITPDIRLPTTDIVKVETRSSLDGDDEPWKWFWERFRGASNVYRDDHELEDLLDVVRLSAEIE